MTRLFEKDQAFYKTLYYIDDDDVIESLVMNESITKEEGEEWKDDYTKINTDLYYDERDLLERELFNDACSILNKLYENEYILATADLGCWDGRYTGGKYIGLWNHIEGGRTSGEDLIYEIVGDGNLEKIELDTRTGITYIEVSHHDGRNYFELHPVNEKADEIEFNWRNGIRGFTKLEEAIHHEMLEESEGYRPKFLLDVCKEYSF